MALARVLIPLDGSEPSALAVQLAAAVVPGDVESVFLQVVPTAADAASARRYLQEVADSSPGSSSTRVDISDDPALQILRVVEAISADLVVLMTHGRGGLKRWMWGSVAEHLARNCPVPLLVRSTHDAHIEQSPVQCILVPLDGSDEADAVLPYLPTLARAHNAEVVLVSAYWVEVADNALSVTQELERARQTAEDLLARRVASLESAELSVRTQVVRGHAAGVILDAAKSLDAGLIAMTTHGRSGVTRWLLGSVAERVLRSSPAPVFLVRSPGR